MPPPEHIRVKLFVRPMTFIFGRFEFHGWVGVW